MGRSAFLKGDPFGDLFPNGHSFGAIVGRKRHSLSNHHNQATQILPSAAHRASTQILPAGAHRDFESNHSTIDDYVNGFEHSARS